MATKNLKKAKDGTTVRNTLSGGTRTRTVTGNTVNITKTDKAGNIIKTKTRDRIMQDVKGDPSESNGSFARKGAIIKNSLTKAQKGRVVKGVSWINDGIKKGNNTPTDTGNPMADGFNRGIASVKDFGKGVSEGFKSSVKGVGNMINTVANSSTRDKDKTPNTPKHKKGGMTKAKKFAALAPPYNKATAADRIAGAKKKKK
jgi:hypothetical protein